MKRFITLSILSLALLTACGKTPSTNQSATDQKNPEVVQEMKELSTNMVAASKDLSISQVLGNIAFKSYDSLTIKYGTSAKSLTASKTFNGKDGFVKLENLKPDTEYSYEIYNDTNRISMGTMKTQKK